ncbi:unnamed protein product [Rotaria sp. Silwood1]|nr:unnamed protein product [Rotaria sp. Silwood1]
MEELDHLAEALDNIDVQYGSDGKDRSNPLWAKRVAEKDHVVHEMYKLVQTVSDSFPLTSYLISQSHGRQIVALQRIRFKKDPVHLDLVCYMILNSSSNFYQFHTLNTLAASMNQCDYRQLIQIQQTLVQYIPPKETSRSNMKFQLLEIIKPMLVFSMAEIVEHTFWWRDVESKFFNSLSGISQYRISNLYVIRNHRLFQQFEEYRSKFRQHVQIMFVYHGSSRECLRAIAKNGFLEPKELSQMSNIDLKSHKISILDSGYFGRGIYQGFAADYAIHYAETYKNSDEIILSAVLPGHSYAVKKGGEKFGRHCEPGFDSHISPEAKEIVLFKSAQILPMFIIRFIRVPNEKIAEEQP